MSTRTFRPLAALGMGTALLTGCGWQLGASPGAGVPRATGASVEPGARLALARGAAGAPVALELLAVEEIARAASVDGIAAWSASVRARVGTLDRPGCAGELAAERMWVAGAPDRAWVARSDAVAAAAEEIGRRAVEAVATEPACRP